MKKLSHKIVNKVLGLLLIFGCTFILSPKMFAQSVMEVNNSSLLYRDYPNQVKIGFTHIVPENIYISCIDCDTLYKSTEEPSSYIIYPSNSSRCQLNIYSSKAKDSLINRHYFMVRNLPEPSIHYSGCFAPCKTAHVHSRLFMRFHPITQLNSKFTIKNWRVKIGQDVYEGEGSEFSKQVVSVLKSLKVDTKIHITLSYIGQDLDQELKTVSDTFEIRKASDQNNTTNEYSYGCE